MQQLSNAIIPDRPSYPEKVLQFGGGNFLRGFTDWMLQQLNKKGLFNGSVVVVQPTPNGQVQLLNDQDGLYTLYLRGLKNGQPQSEHELITVISRGINPYTDKNAYLQTAENPDMRFVFSNTTEAGIAYTETAPPADTTPLSFPGKLAIWLHHRYEHFAGDTTRGVHIIPCELIEKNGDKLKEILITLSNDWNYGKEFVNWLTTACTFSNTMVDRIVPGYPKDRLAEVKEELGYDDKQIVEGEPFHLWVIEAPKAVQDELPFPSIGLDVLYVDDLTPYRTRKVRILNGAHTTLTPVAYLYGINTVREAVDDPAVGKFLRQAIFEEIIPTLDLPKAELEQFAGDVIDRFRNPYIKHQLLSIALNSWSKFETRVMPTILEYKKRTGKIPQRLAFSLAATIAFYEGRRGDEEIKLNDDPEVIALLKNAWASASIDEDGIASVVNAVLRFEKIWKRNLTEVDGLAKAVTKLLLAIKQQGIAAALSSLSDTE